MSTEKDHISSFVDAIKRDSESAIDHLIQESVLEQFFLDFKLLRTISSKRPRSLHEDDRNNLAKAISGFGNSEGGLLIWGVQCSKDKNGSIIQKKHPFENYDIIVSLLNEAVSRSTVPVHTAVENFPVVSDSELGKGYAVTVIPKSDSAPHQSLRDLTYYMRAGDSFIPVPHGILEGLFGKRPQPNIIIEFTVPRVLNVETVNGKKRLVYELGLQLVNTGRGIARDHFINVLISPPKGGSEVYYKCPDPNYGYTRIFDIGVNCIARHDYRIAPFQRIQPIIIGFKFGPPFEKDLLIKLIYGSEGAATKHSKLHWDTQNLADLYTEYVNLSPDQLRDCDFATKFLKEEKIKHEFY